MNIPPKKARPVAPEPMRAWVTEVFEKVGLAEEDAALLARLLVLNDLRGVFSHGTRQVPGYVELFRGGRLNPRPQVEVVSDQGATLLVDGDGGLGYFPSWRAAHLLVEKCRQHGIAAAVTRNHGHFGAAGLYSRVSAEAGQIGYVTSGHQLSLDPSESLYAAAGGSPMSFAVPSGEEPPLVLDFGAVHNLYVTPAFLEEILQQAPGIVFRSIGLGTVCQALGGFLAGVTMTHEAQTYTARWPGANQGAFLIAVAIERFMPPEEFLARMADYSRRVRTLQPLPGSDRSVLAGGLEWEREREWAQSGIPISPKHDAALARAGEALGLPLPF